MTRARHRRWMVVAASAAAHAGLLAPLALHAPRLLGRAEAPPIFEVTVAPRYLPPDRAPRTEPAAGPSRPIKPRQAIKRGGPLPVAPLVLPPASPSAPSSPVPSPLLRDALRKGVAGCASPALLTREERDRCLERLGAGAKDAPFFEPPMSREKRAAFEAAAARQEAYRKYKEANMPPGLTQRDGGPQMKELPPVWPPD